MTRRRRTSSQKMAAKRRHKRLPVPILPILSPLLLTLCLATFITTSHALAVPTPPSVTTPYSNKIAVILNLNARCVNEDFVHAAEDIVGAENVFATATHEENDDAVQTIVKRGYGTIVPGGGDGTLCTAINSLVDARRSHNIHDETKLPKFAFLPLGTGNGMAMLVGPRFGGRTKVIKMKKTLTRLKEIIDECEIDKGVVMPLLKCPMIEVTRPTKASSTSATKVTAEGGGSNSSTELCFFAGSGFDSLMLNDFNVIKRWSKRRYRPIRRFFGSVAGYTVALLTRTLPQCLLWGKHKLLARVTIPKASASIDASRATSTYWMDPRRGDTAIKVRPNSCESDESVFPDAIGDDRQLLFEGRVGIIAAGTTPYYGGGMKLFPFSRVQPHGMHLRLGRINPFVGFLHIPWIFRGSYRHYDMGCLDFVGKDFEIELSEPYPFQHSGEADDDPIKQFRIRIAEEEIEFVDFLKPRLIVGY